MERIGFKVENQEELSLLCEYFRQVLGEKIFRYPNCELRVGGFPIIVWYKYKPDRNHLEYCSHHATLLDCQNCNNYFGMDHGKLCQGLPRFISYLRLEKLKRLRY